MAETLVLASASPVRAHLLREAGVSFEVQPARIDEPAIRAGLEAEGAPPRDIADKLAELKARKTSARVAGALVLGCDQVLGHAGRVFGKPETPQQARAQLQSLRGKTHQLISAAVICEDGEPVWRHATTVRLKMRPFSDIWLDAYLARNWESVRASVGGYKLEEEGVRLFSAVEGDYFSVLGLPLLPLLAYLGLRGVIET